MVPVLLLTVSGTALVFKEPWWRWQYPALNKPLPQLTPADHARAIETISQRFGDAARTVQWPEPGRPVYQVWLHDESRAFVEPLTHSVIAHWQWHASVVSVLEELHFALLGGHTGEEVVGYIGLVVSLIALVGVVLWWPERRRMFWRAFIPPRWTIAALVKLHRSLGVLSAPVVLLVLVTGTGVSFYFVVSEWLGKPIGAPSVGSFGAPALPAGVSAQPLPSLASILETAHRQLPGAEIRFFTPPSADNPMYTLRMKLPAELHPNGRSYVYVDARDGSVLKTIDATQLPLNLKITNSFYPLHAAKFGGWPVKALLVCSGVALTALTVIGFTAWWRRQRAVRLNRAGRAERD